MNEVDFRNNLAATTENLRSNATLAAEEAIRAAGLASIVSNHIEEDQLLEATEGLEKAREALIEAGQLMMQGLKGTRLDNLAKGPGQNRRTED